MVTLHKSLGDFKRVCYVRPEPELPVHRAISDKLCTHLIIGFAIIENNVIRVDTKTGSFISYCKALLNVTKTTGANDVQLMLSIGGGNNDQGFHPMSSTPTNRRQFAISALEIMLKYGLHGLDLDWEFPAWGNTYYEDKQNFYLVLKELREIFTTFTVQTSRPPLVITVALAAQYTIIERSYNVPELIKYVDFINLMAYDYYVYHWYWPFIDHNSPLFGRRRTQHLFIFGTLNTDWSANYYNRLGVPKDRIIIGIPTYGRSYQLMFPWYPRPGSLALASNQDMSFTEVCRFLKTPGTTVEWDQESGVPYAYRDNQWLTFESRESAAQKVEWIIRNGFGGSMTFSLNADDYRNECYDNSQPFAIQSAIKEISLKMLS
ncbi:acidic mammalian chitinase-like [Oppia nitens]|uniref:acidic mammalian chitinase-like n=1 Tax=Oppia nitens TaxID=1686743 RepID=UPI0023DA50E2|nr:acidic mammalian chitinase-like [Oppia nitens]